METYQNLSLEDLPNEIWKDVVGYEGSTLIKDFPSTKDASKY